MNSSMAPTVGGHAPCARPRLKSGHITKPGGLDSATRGPNAIAHARVGRRRTRHVSAPRGVMMELTWATPDSGGPCRYPVQIGIARAMDIRHAAFAAGAQAGSMALTTTSFTRRVVRQATPNPVSTLTSYSIAPKGPSQSGIRESNPSLEDGSLTFYR